MKDASFQGDMHSVIAAAERRAFLLGFRDHQEGTPCRHGYGPGDHHWESGTCLAERWVTLRQRATGSSDGR